MEKKLKNPRSWPVALLLATVFGAVMSIAMVITMGVMLYLLGRNTVDLAKQTAELFALGARDQVIAQLNPVDLTLTNLSRAVASSNLQISDPRVPTLLQGALAASPLVDAMVWQPVEGMALIARREENGAIDILKIDAWSETSLQPFIERVQSLAREDAVVWSAPLYWEDDEAALVLAAHPMRNKKGLLGFLVAAIRLTDLSKAVVSWGEQYGGEGFVLYGGRKVMAHRNLPEYEGAASFAMNLPSLTDLRDPVLPLIHDPRTETLPTGESVYKVQFIDEKISPSGRAIIVISTNLVGFGPEPWQIGRYYFADDVDDVFKRLSYAAALGVAATLGTILVAYVVGRILSRPIRQFADIANRVGALELSDVGRLPGSRVDELAQMRHSFEAMISTLQWFESYVPRWLVKRLLNAGRGIEIPSRIEKVTVMFTDIAGFSKMAAGIDAGQLATKLNAHFAELTEAIEASGGTVDKFIGDAVMAFWGAPDRQEDHPQRALTAARDIAARMARLGNEFGLRIGIHCGEVLVGNIGAPQRLNFTIVGEVVNIAQRLEAFGKKHPSGHNVTIMASQDLIELAGNPDDFKPLGVHELPGTGPVSVYIFSESATGSSSGTSKPA